MINSKINFLESDYSPNLNNPILTKVRGSVRLMMGRFITPQDASSHFTTVINTKLFK